MTTPAGIRRHRRPPTSLLVLGLPLVIALLLAGARPCHAQPAPVRDADDDASALDLLSRAMYAAGSVAYQGVQVVALTVDGRTTSRTVRVCNYPGRGTYVDVGRGRRQPGGALLTSIAYDPGELGLLAANYRLVRRGVARLAGRVAEIVDARRDAATAARFWLDRATGLMLGREVFDRRGRTVRETAFRTIRFTAPPPPRHLPARVSSTDLGHPVPLREVGSLRGRGWTVPGALAGVLALYDVRTSGQGDEVALHLSYSDGVSAVSVFEQHGHLDEAHLAGWHQATVAGRTVQVRDTVPRQIAWAGHGTVFTVVSDAPDAMVARAVRALPGPGPEPGLWDRLVRGLARIFSWCNPF